MKQPLSKIIFFSFFVLAVFLYTTNTAEAQLTAPGLNTQGLEDNNFNTPDPNFNLQNLQSQGTPNSGFNFQNLNPNSIGNISPNIGGSNNFVSNPIRNIGGGSGGGGEYKPITPGYQSFFQSGTDFSGMVTSIFKTSITLTIVLAVIMMIVGGIQYMGSESVFAKGAGKDKIYAALGGLLIALVSILLISTILPGGDGGSFKIDIFG